MPMPITAFKLCCTACNWSKIVALKSDVFSRPQVPAICPSCGCDTLQREQPSLLEKTVVTLAQKLKGQ